MSIKKTHPLNDVVFCTLAPSPIHGVGVFAIRDIPAGTELFGGNKHYSRIDEKAILPAIWNMMQDRWCLLEYCSVLPNPNWDVVLQRFMNHSPTPNSDGERALRNIEKGEEVTEDFSQFGLGLKAQEYYKNFL